MRTDARVSIIIPLYNERSNLPELTQRLSEMMEGLTRECGARFEVIFVDDHSHDETPDFIRALSREKPVFKLLRLARNAGSHAALAAGLHLCRGTCAVLMAGDLQDPPELVPELYKHWSEGNDVVWATRQQREGESLLTRFLAGVYYHVMRTIALPETPPTGADFVLVDRRVIAAYLRCAEKNTSIMSMFLWLGFRQCFIPYVKQARLSGHTKWTFRKKIKLFVDSVVSFSTFPLRCIHWCGSLACLGGLVAVIILVVQLLLGEPARGWVVVLAIVLFMGGMQMYALSVLGQYLWRTYDEARGRPRFVIEEFVSQDVGPEVGDVEGGKVP